ncbi:MAG: hypothetical protein ACNA8J_05270 [Gammaproteobacteria bacterium]
MRLHRFASTGLLLCALLIFGGCTTHITPPTEVEEPAMVFVLDHGRHTSLVVSTPEGALVRYAYGDWRYYAERETGVIPAIAALLWNTPAALGRRELPGPPTSEAVREQVPLVISAVYGIEVERTRIETLRVELDAVFDEAEEVRETPETQLFFVRYPRAYNLRHNSNTVIADWLERLGCETRGPALVASWRIKRPTTGE